MPTSHRRHAITETDDISAALAAARRAWPDLADKPGALLRRLILSGKDALADEHAAAEKVRLRAVEATSGAFAGVFGPEYLNQLRDDWPE